MMPNEDIEVDVVFDNRIGKFRIIDPYGEFVPISIPMWQHCIEKPFQIMNAEKGTTIQRVLQIFMSDYSYLYICKN